MLYSTRLKILLHLPVTQLPNAYSALTADKIFTEMATISAVAPVHLYSFPYYTDTEYGALVPCFDKDERIPIIRTGYLAYPPRHDFKKKKRGLTDLRAKEGDSGAPLIIYHEPFSVSEASRQGRHLLYPFILGIHVAGHELMTKHAVAKDVNHDDEDAFTYINRELHLGIYIKASCLLEMNFS